MSDQITQFKCGSPKHSERSGETDWSDSVLAEIRGEKLPPDNPYRCEACGRLIQEEWDNADNI